MPPRVHIAKLEVTDDDDCAQDRTSAWLALELEFINSVHGEVLFRDNVPCRRRMTRAAEVRHVYVEGGFGQVGGDDTAWDSPLVDGPMALDENGVAGAEAKVEEREIHPAQYAYEAPRVLALLPPGMARWAFEHFKAVEFDSMFRLRDGAPWQTYVEELRAGMESK